MAYYDFERINEIPLKDICYQYGIQLKETSTGFMGKVRNEKTPSFSISKAKGVWSDFGTGESGKTPISLVQYLEGGIDYKLAVEKIANMFNLESESPGNKGWIGLTNSQYKEIGVSGERVTLNLDIDLSKISIEKAEELDDKYGIPMVKLAEENPKLYDMIIKNKALPLIKELRENFHYMNGKYSNENSYVEKELFKSSTMKLEESVNRKVDLLQRALKDNNVDLSYLKVSIDGDINKEVGNVKYSELKKKQGKNRYIEINSKELEKLKKSDLNYSAFTKGKDKYNLIVKEKDLSKTLNIINRVQEKQFGNISYSSLKSMGEVSYLETNKNIALKMIKDMNNENIKLCAFPKDDNKVNMAFQKSDLEKVLSIQRSIKNKAKER